MHRYSGLTCTNAAAADDVKRQRKLRLAEERKAKELQEESNRRAREATVELTAKDVDRLVAATVSKLWRREANRRELCDQLRQHVSRAIPFGPHVILPTMMHLLSSQFDNRTIDEHMSVDRWRTVIEDVTFIVKVNFPPLCLLKKLRLWINRWGSCRCWRRTLNSDLCLWRPTTILTWLPVCFSMQHFLFIYALHANSLYDRCD